MPAIGFLHTAEVHVGTFRGLLRELGPGVDDVHLVDESLLADARERGVDADVECRLLKRLRELAAERPDVIVCTCSTLSGHAERMSGAVGTPVLRVDRPMAEAAVAAGRRIGVVATTASTLGPTRELLASCARADTEIVESLCPDAWPLFAAGDHAGYIRRVVEHARNLDVDVIVLAQASMAPAEEFLGGRALSSPRAAVKRALEL